MYGTRLRHGRPDCRNTRDIVDLCLKVIRHLPFYLGKQVFIRARVAVLHYCNVKYSRSSFRFSLARSHARQTDHLSCRAVQRERSSGALSERCVRLFVTRYRGSALIARKVFQITTHRLCVQVPTRRNFRFPCFIIFNTVLNDELMTGNAYFFPSVPSIPDGNFDSINVAKSLIDSLDRSIK